MAGIFIDPAESFSRALGQGLATFKSFRDEARQDEDRMFNRSMAEKADRRADETLNMAKAGEARAQNEFDYGVSRRPFKEKAEETQLKGFELNNEGQRLQNEWYPKIQGENIRSSRDASARGWAGIRMEGARLSLQQQAFAAEQEERQQRNALRLITQAVRTNDYSQVANNTAAGNAAMKLAAAAAGAPNLINALQNPTGNWSLDPTQKRTVFNVANISMNKTADNLGFQRGSVSMLDMRPKKGSKGTVEIDFIGYDPKSGRMVKKTGNMAATQLFDKAAVFANTMNRISADPRARTALVSAFRSSDPEMFSEMLDHEIKRRQSAIKGLQDRTLKVENPRQYMAELSREVMLLENGDTDALNKIIFPRMGQVGQEQATPHTQRAFDRVSRFGNGNKPDDVVTGINSVIERASRDRKYYDKILRDGGIPNYGEFDPMKVIRAISAS